MGALLSIIYVQKVGIWIAKAVESEKQKRMRTPDVHSKTLLVSKMSLTQIKQPTVSKLKITNL